MSTHTTIEWTDVTWNPVRGCSRVSPGCQRCYAERMAHRFSGKGMPYAGLTRSGRGGPRWTNRIALVPELLREPSTWRRPRRVFVNSMSDLFHEGIPEEFVVSVFRVMQEASSHTFQVLTKRADRMREMAPRLPLGNNVWMGVSVESDDFAGRVDQLRHVPSRVRFLSLEPLLGPCRAVDLSGMDWVIVGGESGPGARPVRVEWVRDLRDRCAASSIPFFFKQWGGAQKKRTGRTLDGRIHDELPPP